MAISEAARSDLYTGLREVLGPERAETLMSAIPLHHLDEVATKGDLALLKADIEAKIAQLEAKVASEIAGLRAEFKTDIGALRKSMTNWMLTLMVAIIGAMATIGFLS